MGDWVEFAFWLIWPCLLTQNQGLKREGTIRCISIARGLAHTSAVGLWFYAMARIPIEDVTAMNYMSPIYVTIDAHCF